MSATDIDTKAYTPFDMSAKDIDTKAFWRAKYARHCIKKFQADQLRSILFTPPSLPGAPPEVPPKPPILVDRPPIYKIPSPIPILKSRAAPAPEGPAPAAEEVTEVAVAEGVVRTLPAAAPLPSITSAEDPKKICVGIIGAGAAGLYTAMILQDLKIDYEILEGSERAGGRVRTHFFQESKSPWNYFDLGAMRYPKIPIMWRVFDLFENRLGLRPKMINYIMNSRNQFLEYNRICIQQHNFDGSSHSADVFQDGPNLSPNNSGPVPRSYIERGVDHWLDECFSPFRQLLRSDFDSGWAKLMEYDGYSTRSFMATAFNESLDEHGQIFLRKDAYPDAVINWMERRNTGTGIFDMAFTEMVMDDLQFAWPNATAVKFGAATSQGADQEWYSLEGGSEIFIKGMVKKLNKKIQFNKRITKIVPTANEKPLSVSYSTFNSKATTDFDYVISTVPLPALRLVDLDMCNLSYAQIEGMRTLHYDSSCKVGIKFRSRWWQNLPSGSIVGGLSRTDRIIRTAVFPSYGVQDPNADAVMIASYTWSQDASRVGGLMHGRDSVSEKFLIENILEDLSIIHSIPLDTLIDELEDWCAWDWYAHPFSLGAYALFGPGQFSNTYPAFGQGAAGGRLLFAGEALSAQHSWVEGALNSAYAAVERLLHGAGLTQKLQRLEAEWGNQAEQLSGIAWLQAIIGAVLSMGEDRDVVQQTFGQLGVQP